MVSMVHHYYERYCVRINRKQKKVYIFSVNRVFIHEVMAIKQQELFILKHYLFNIPSLSVFNEWFLHSRQSKGVRPK